MGNNGSATLIEPLPASQNHRSPFAFDSTYQGSDIDIQSIGHLDLDERGLNQFGALRDLHHSPPGAPSWTLQQRMELQATQSKNANVMPGQVTRRNPPAKPPGVVDNNSDYGSFDSDNDKLSTLNPKAAAEVAINEIDHILATAPNQALATNRQRGQSLQNHESFHHRAYSTSPSMSAVIDGKGYGGAPGSRNQFNAPTSTPVDWSTRKESSIDGLEREAFPRPSPRGSANGQRHQATPDSSNASGKHSSHGPGKLPSYDDVEQQLIDSIETEYSRAEHAYDH